MRLPCDVEQRINPYGIVGQVGRSSPTTKLGLEALRHTVGITSGKTVLIADSFSIDLCSRSRTASRRPAADRFRSAPQSTAAPVMGEKRDLSSADVHTKVVLYHAPSRSSATHMSAGAVKKEPAPTCCATTAVISVGKHPLDTS